MDGGEHWDNGDVDYSDPEDPSGPCDPCTILQFIADKVTTIDERLAKLEAYFGDLDQQSVWYREWDFQPELTFVPPSPPPTTGSGLGIGAIFGLLYAIANLVMLTHEDTSKRDDCLAMPEHWQLKPEGHRPQLVMKLAEMREDGTLGSAKYRVTIPHYQLPQGTVPPPINYIYKGRYYGVLLLNDNSKVQVYCDSEWEARRVLSQLSAWINPLHLNGTYIRTGEISNPDFKEIRVFPKYATYWDRGSHPDSVPTKIYWGQA